MVLHRAWKSRLVTTGKKSLVFLLLVSWVFSGWPQIQTSHPFPPDVLDANAAEVQIDASVSTVGTSHIIFGSQMVFISDQTGYRFYRDSSGECVYSKTTDGGASWGGAVIVDDQGTGTDCINIAVWYDQWTPGDTGTSIHIVTLDTGSDSLFYNAIDTANSDTRLTGTTAIDTDPGATQGATITAGTSYPSITKGTNGTLYVTTIDAQDQFVLMCSTTCGTASNWSEDDGGSPAELANEGQLLVPLPNGAVMFIENDTSASDILTKVYTGGTWDANFATVDSNAVDNTTYDQQMAATVDPKTGDIYLAYLADVSTLGRNDDIRTAVYSGGSWNAGTADVLTDDQRGLTGVSIAFDSNTADVYVAYTATSTNGTAAQQNVYWKKSTDGMATWGSEQGAVNTTVDDLYGVTLNTVSDQRIHVSWDYQTADDVYGDTIANLVPPTYTQAAYRFYANTDSTDVGSVLAGQNTPATLSAANDTFRLRLLLSVGGDGARASLDSFKLQYAERVGTCDTSYTSETYNDVTTGTPVAFSNNASVADGTTLTGNANDPDLGNTVIDQTYEELNNFSNSSSKVLGGQDALWDFSLVDNGATAGTVYCFRVVYADGSAIETPTVIPQVSIASGVTVSVTITANGTIAYDFMEAGSTTSTIELGTTIVVQNSGSGAEDFNIKGQNTACWTLAASAGSEQYVHEFSTTTGSVWTPLTTSDQSMITNVAAAASQNLDLQLSTPTLTSCYTVQSVDVTITAVQH